MLFYLSQSRHYCTKINKNKLYSSTILLPHTKFPLRLENKKLVERDKNINESAAFKTLYSWQNENLKEPTFILHDGPPYANGSPHIGHVINKVLKDIILRCNILKGRKVNYIPGWDCHGLPIELKAVKKSKTQLSPVEIRQKARSFATETIEKQMKAFKSWGIVGDWDNTYKTFNVDFIKNELRQFYNLYQKKLIYRDVKPVYWSPSTRTALAEAELEYNPEHKSVSTTVKLKILKYPDEINNDRSTIVHALIWTTTPWTLPSNQAICYNEKLSYSLVQKSTEPDLYIVATDLIETLSKKLGMEMKIIKSFSGSLLDGVTYQHPLDKTELPFLNANHATAAKGTGLVHTAPAHGPDDFLVALNQNIAIKCLVDEHGCYTSDAGPDLENSFVLGDGLKKVLTLINADIVHKEDYVHSYPYDWRTKQPIILRASKQWFIDTSAIKNRAVDLFDDVEIMPKMYSETYKNNIINQLKKRPYWCISRQRLWGVPIPVFYHKVSEKPIINQAIINHLCNIIDSNSTDYWWNLPIEKLIPDKILLEENIKLEDIEKGQDILDIWFDSGISWSSVLGNDKIADIYLEGVDQFTGWFQSSLLTSVALRDKAPYKNVYVHGFAVDEKGMKMSKSLGNVVDPINILQGNNENKPFGIDALRWWVAFHANQDSTVEVSSNILQSSADEVQKVRNVMRFALGALNDFKNSVANYNSLHLIDKYLLHLLYSFNKQIDKYEENYKFNKICTTTLNLLTNQASALYYTSIKDRLYCEPADSDSRRAAQYTILQLFYSVSKRIGPIIPHLIEELYSYLPIKKTNYFFQLSYNVEEYWNDANLEKVMNVIISIKRDIHKNVGTNTIDKKVCVEVSSSFFASLQDSVKLIHIEPQMCDIFQVSEVKLIENANLCDQEFLVDVSKSDFSVCNRCRRYSSSCVDQLCERCALVIENSCKESIQTL